MIEFILIICIGFSLYALASRDLLAGTIAMSGVSLTSALLFYLLRAPDVAITEAAVGAGISTIVYIWAVRSTDRRDST